MAVLGVAFAGMQLLPFSMLPDVIRAGAAAPPAPTPGCGRPPRPPAAALGPWAYSLCLAGGGFVASTAGQTVLQSDAALAAVRYGFGLLPAVLMLVALLRQRRYTLDRVARVGGPPAHPGSL